jgi:hypothetical protein
VRAEGTESKGSGYALSTDSYYAPVYAFHHDISDQRRANADAVLNQDEEATTLCTMKALIKREKLWVSNFFVTGIWTGQRAGDATPTGTQFLYWSDANSTPIEDVRAAKLAVLELTGFEPNTFTISPHVMNALLDHPDIVDRVKYGQTPGGIAQVDMTELAAIFKVSKVLVAKAIQNTAAEGVTNAHSFIAGKNALLTYRPPAPGLMTPAAGYSFSWNGMFGASALGSRIKRFRQENIASDRIEIEMAMVHKKISADLGYMFLGAVP